MFEGEDLTGIDSTCVTAITAEDNDLPGIEPEGSTTMRTIDLSDNSTQNEHSQIIWVDR